MPLSTYVEFNEVRAALGVNATELKDAVLALPVYEIGLVRELRKVSPALAASFSSIAAKAPAQRTAEEAELFGAVRTFSVYAVAKQVGVSLPTMLPKDITDGKASISRFSAEVVQRTLEAVGAAYAQARTNLQDVLAEAAGGSSAVAAVPVIFSAVTRATDVVTGA